MVFPNNTVQTMLSLVIDEYNYNIIKILLIQADNPFILSQNYIQNLTQIYNPNEGLRVNQKKLQEMQISIHSEQVETLMAMMLRFHKENIEKVEENKKLKETIQYLNSSTPLSEVWIFNNMQVVNANQIPDEIDQTSKVILKVDEQEKQSQVLFRTQNEKKMINACIRTEKHGYSLYECRICHRIYKTGKQLTIHYEQRHSCQEGYFIRTSVFISQLSFRKRKKRPDEVFSFKYFKLQNVISQFFKQMNIIYIIELINLQF
ncbi:hypothetical protein pb186bvf_012900 [Paramecium bursaria]